MQKCNELRAVSIAAALLRRLPYKIYLVFGEERGAGMRRMIMSTSALFAA